MFDDPKRALNRMQQELLAEEDFEEDGFDDDLADIKALLERDDGPDTVRNYANGYGRTPVRQEEAFDYSEYWDEDDRMLYTDEDVEDRAVYRDYGRRPKKEKEPREKGIRGLVILACLELMGILGILGWWMVWLL